MRVVTTLPSATELVVALGIEPVGVSHECDYPPRMTGLPAVTSSRVDASATSGEIDRQVLEADASGGVYDVDLATLERLDPDLIVTQGVCDVCAVDASVVDRALERIDADPAVVTTHAHTVDDVLGDLTRLGRLLDREERAASVVAELEDRIEAVAGRTSDVAQPARPRVAVLDWTDPVMVAAHWMPELVAFAGGEYGLAEPGADSRPREWAEICEYDPEVLVVAPCGFELDQTAANLSDLTEREGWASLSAVRDGRAWAMDGHHYANRPGPRLVDTLEALGPIVQPDRFAGRPPASVATPLGDLLERVDP